jgi:ribosomal protein L29
MKISEIRLKKEKELHELLASKRKDLVEQQRSLAAGELPNPRVVSGTKRDIARIHTALKQLVTDTSKGDA